MTHPVDVGDEAERLDAMRDALAERGYVDIVDDTLPVGQRVRHRYERYPEAYDNGTGVVVSVMEHFDSPWSRSWGERDVELVVLRDRPLLPDMSRLSGVANYHVEAVR